MHDFFHSEKFRLARTDQNFSYATCAGPAAFSPTSSHSSSHSPSVHKLTSPPQQSRSFFCDGIKMKYSPVMTNILPLSNRGSPDSSNRSSLRGLVAIHAGESEYTLLVHHDLRPFSTSKCRVSCRFDSVTLACTAAFAAGSVALLCMFIVSGQTNSGGRFIGLPPPSDWPQNTMDYESRETFDHFKVTDVVKVYENTGVSNRFGRRALRPTLLKVDDNRVDNAWPTGAVWLMVSR